jgi:hypothetical protein
LLKSMAMTRRSRSVADTDPPSLGRAIVDATL